MAPTYRLMIVEDSADDAELLLHALRDAPFTISSVRVEDENAFVAALAREPFDAILSDYHMPRFSTERALQILHERQLDVPFIIVSHQIGEEAAVAAMQAGASDYLLKNRLGRLGRAIESAVERRSFRSQRAAAESALRASESIKRGILNSLATRIAVLDGSGTIIAVNKAWENFRSVRASVYQLPAVLGSNYLDMLNAAVTEGDELAERGLAALKAVIARESEFESVEYELQIDHGTRRYIARAMPLEGSADGAVVSHEDVTDRMLAHIALHDANKRLQVLSKRILGVQEEERRSISRELHDDIGQSMTALKIGLHRISQRATEEQRPLVNECLAIAGSTLDKVRNLSLELRPPQLDQLGLEDALGWLVDRQQGATGIKIECTCSGLPPRLPTELESACYRIAQEALNNATRHAHAKHIQIIVSATDRLLKLQIRDDGVGFDVDAARQRALKSGSLGLISMEERALLAGGRLKMRTVPHAGTTVQATFTLDNTDVEKT